MCLWPVILSLVIPAIAPTSAYREPTKADIPAGLPPQLKTLIEQALSDHFTVREEACKALEAIRDPRAVEPLIGALHDRVPDVRSAAAEALGHIGDRRAVPVLLDVLHDGSQFDYVRVAAMDALAHLDGTMAVPVLTRLAKAESESERLRYRAAIRVVKVTDGAIKHIGVVLSLRLYFYCITLEFDANKCCGTSYRC